MGALRNESRLRGLHPQLVILVKTWGVRLTFDIEILSGVRTNVEQAALYAQGRTAPGKIVTQAATAALSPHGRRFFSGDAYGAAFDAMSLDDAGRLQWDENGRATPEGLARLRMMSILSERQAVTWGGSWVSFPDLMHFQLENWRKAPPAPDEAPTPTGTGRALVAAVDDVDFSDVAGGSSTI